ncbi:MAG: TraR/DksA C4-type zinc finger protein [Desulfobacterales bacterium]|nr:TraR/DksA C4-type zinc finger protein [Desulfobacterales bacterium]
MAQKITVGVTGVESDDYMDSTQLSYFKDKLLAHKKDLLAKLKDIKGEIKKMQFENADIVDRSNLISARERAIDFSTRYGQIIRQIDQALNRIDDGSFGYCELTGEEIGLKRLDIQPWTNLSIHALEEIERTAALTGNKD